MTSKDCRNPKLGKGKPTGTIAWCWHVCSHSAGTQMRKRETGHGVGWGGGGVACQGDRLYVSEYDRSLGETAAGDSPGTASHLRFNNNIYIASLKWGHQRAWQDGKSNQIEWVSKREREWGKETDCQAILPCAHIYLCVNVWLGVCFSVFAYVSASCVQLCMFQCVSVCVCVPSSFCFLCETVCPFLSLCHHI